MLPTKVYEFLRWFITIVIPAGLTLFLSLNATCGWGIDGEMVAAVTTAITTFLGVIFGISKITHDKMAN